MAQGAGGDRALVGFGKAVYVGTSGDQSLKHSLVVWAVQQAGLHPGMETPPGVEAAHRWQGDQQLLFLLNHSDEEKEVQLPASAEDLLTGQRMEGRLRLPPKAVFILR